MTIAERDEPQALSLLLGFAAVLPLALAAVCAWVLPGMRAWAALLAVLWGGAILCFLAGVRRGVSFRTEGGATAAQIATMLWLFLLGLGALAGFFLMRTTIGALAVLAVGYASVAVLDPVAARRGEAPLFFARLRPVQMAIAVVSLLALIARLTL